MSDWRILSTIAAVGATSYAMRVSGFLAAGALPNTGALRRLLRLAPGNMFIAFAAASCFEGGWPSLAGGLLSLATMVVTKREWAALTAGFVAAAMAAAFRSG